MFSLAGQIFEPKPDERTLNRCPVHIAIAGRKAALKPICSRQEVVNANAEVEIMLYGKCVANRARSQPPVLVREPALVGVGARAVPEIVQIANWVAIGINAQHLNSPCRKLALDQIPMECLEQWA